MSFTYSRHTMRVAKARLANRLNRGFLAALYLVALLFLVLTVFLVASGQNIGYVMFYPSVVCFMILIWNHWDLEELDGGNPVASGSMELDALLSADIVAKLSDTSTTKDVWIVTAGNWQGAFFYNRFLLPPAELQVAVATDALSGEALYSKALELAKKAGLTHITAGSLMVAMLSGPTTKQLLAKLKLNDEDMFAGLAWQKQLLDRLNRHDKQLFGGIARDWASGYTPILDRFGTNISRQIEGGYDFFSSSARQKELDQAIQILSRGNRNSIALVGPIGSGKSEVVFALAERMLEGGYTGSLDYKQIIKLDAGRLVSQLSAGGGNIEDLMQRVFYDAWHARNIVLLLDDADLFMHTSPGSIDISQIIAQFLEQTNLPLILTMTPDAAHKFAATKPALFAMLNTIELPDLDTPAVMTILADLAIPIEVKNKVTITYFALREAIQLSARYVTNKAYPAKAIDLLQDSINYAENGHVTGESVETALERLTGTKVGAAQAVEKSKLLKLEDIIHERMINQTQAVSAVSEALRRSRAGVRDPKRPAGSFLLLGPTGVGKTELARSLAAVYYGGEDRMIRLDMSEYQQTSDITRLLEAPSESGAGSAFLRSMTQRPFSVVLLDEIEKAHPDILNLLLQMLDEGRLTDTSGKSVSFKEAIIIVTSNAGADDIRTRIAGGGDLPGFKDELVNKIISAGSFKPELINRFDEVVLFRPLTPEELAQVVKIMLVGLNKTLAAQNITVALTDAAISFIVTHGYDAQMGARPMRRALQQYVENTISRRILADELQAGTAITLDVKDLETAEEPAA